MLPAAHDIHPQLQLLGAENETIPVLSSSLIASIPLPAVSQPALTVSSSPLYATQLFNAASSSYGAKALCYYKYGAGIADASALSALLLPRENAAAAGVSTVTTFYAASTDQVNVRSMCSYPVV